jgi:arylsulfatase A-like enzyme
MPNTFIQASLATVLLSAAAGTAGDVAHRAMGAPNIVFILVDDLGYGDLSCYGATDLRTPHIDGLAEQGLRFTHAYANCPVCSPTRASLLTGRYPGNAGVPGVIRTHATDNWGYLAPDAVLLPQRLREAGYETAIIGKWHLGLRPENHPVRRGFGRFRGFLGDMMDDYEHHRRHDINYMRHDFDEIDPDGHATDLFTDWACEYIETSAPRDEPYLLYLAYNAPHSPIQPPATWVQRVRARDPDLPEKRAKFVAFVEHLDDGIGRVLRSIESSGEADDTLIVFTSDNGGATWFGASNCELRGTKGGMYEGGIRVPQIVVWSDHVESQTETPLDMLTMDWYPTLCELVGLDPPNDIDGLSFAALLTGDPQAPAERPLFWERREGGDRFMGKVAYAARLGPWKICQPSPNEPFELYNLADDPRETTDLRESEPKRFRELARMLQSHIQASGRVPWQPPDEPAITPSASP